MTAATVVEARAQANNQLDAALEHLSALGSEPLDAPAFEEAAGVGVEVSPQEVAAAVGAVVSANEAVLQEKRYTVNTTILLGQVKPACASQAAAAWRRCAPWKRRAVLRPSTSRKEPAKEPVLVSTLHAHCCDTACLELW